ncbi:hypothetical protein ACFPRA_11825 [Sporosarcina soli]|uniref:MFS transporter n=1 Tax=Sporosarcina soli TaxID=334736 RepID=A0ABW0TLA1_9BACL
MIEKLLRFPFFQSILLTFVGIILLNKFHPYLLPELLTNVYLKLVLIGVLIFWFIIVFVYNRQNPKNKFKFFTFLPVELREEDEGLRWMTFKACRSVYIYYSFAIPVGIGLVTYFNGYSFAPLIIFILLGIGQYIIYWLEIKKLYD